MPELPEVETIVRGLKELIIGRIIIEVRVRETKLVAFPDENEFISKLKGKEVINLRRRGKYILIDLKQGKTLVIHLRMTGQLVVKPRKEIYAKHTHIIFEFDNDLDLRFNCIRKFGRAYLVDTGQWGDVGGLGKLGPEPLSPDFFLKDFKNRFKSRHGKIKSLLLNQNFIAGLGNIYTDEALFQAGIMPNRKVETLVPQEIKKLYYSIRKVLKMGIEYGGTSMRDYVNARGEKGLFQNRLMVYQRAGENCFHCKGEIVKTKIAGRSTYYCPNCQK